MTMQQIKRHLVVAAAGAFLMFPLVSNAGTETPARAPKDAAASHPPVTMDAATHDTSSEKHVVALKSLRPESGPIHLMGIQNSAQISFPVSARQKLSDLALELYVTNSIALTDRSHMAVALNGVVVGQIPLRAQTPETHAHIAIPAELIQAGYNQITFNVAQHYADNCEDFSSPELWSEIDTSRSQISYSVSAQPIKPNLAELPLLMDKRLLGLYTLTIATPAALDDNVIEAGGLVAQAAALSRDYAALAIKHATLPKADSTKSTSLAALPADLFNGGDGVLVGSREALAPWLDKEMRALAAEPLLALFPFGAQSEHFVLVVTGADNTQVHQAAQMLAQSYASLPPAAKASFKEIPSLSINPRPLLRPGINHDFADFAFHTTTRQGIYPLGMNIRFWVPADHFAYPGSKLNLSLHLAYGAGFGSQSVLNVFLNNHFEHAVRLADPLGAVYYDYRLAIPVSSLVPGWNELQFQPSMIPQRAEGRCQPVYTDNLLVTLFDDSSIESADMMQLTELPDLGLFGHTGFPFAGGRDGAQLRLALTGHESGTLEAAWTLLGKLAQVNNAPITRIQMVAPGSADDDTLVVGQIDKVPLSLLQHSSLNQLGWWRSGRSGAANSGLFNFMLGHDANAATAASKITSVTLPNYSLVMTQFESPVRHGHSVVLVVANTADQLSQQVATLVDAPYWGQLKGGTVVLRKDSETVHHYVAPETYLVGNAGLRARLSHTLAESPSLAIILVIAGIVLLALITWWVLVAYRRHQHDHRIG